MALAMMRLTLPTAFRTPLPPYRAVSPSRSSSASRSPVEAPEGTAARPNAPPASVTSTSTVGFPRESRISRPWSWMIFNSLSSAAAAVGLGFERQSLLVERSDERLVIGGDHDDAGVRDGVPAPILLRVVADARAARDEHVAVDDGPADAGVAADTHARHQDALVDQAEAVDPHVRAEHAAEDAAAGDDATRGDDRIEGLSAAPARFRKHELRGRGLGLICRQRP